MFFYYKIERKPINSVETKIVNHVTGNTISHLSVGECPMAAVRADPTGKIYKNIPLHVDMCILVQVLARACTIVVCFKGCNARLFRKIKMFLTCVGKRGKSFECPLFEYKGPYKSAYVNRP